MCGLNEGIFPTKHADTIDKMEEERRMAYVAYTRAENALFLSDSEGINYDGSFRYPSRFIFNTDKKHLEYIVDLEEKLMNDASIYIKANEERIANVNTGLNVGDKIRHKIWGVGTIIGIKENISSYVIKFDGMETERNLAFRAPLEKIQ